MPRVFISGYANTGKKFSIAFKKYLSREKTQNSSLYGTYKKRNSYQSQRLVPEVLLSVSYTHLTLPTNREV